MNLRNRSLLTLGLTFFIFFIIIAAASLSVTLSGLDRIEYQDMSEAVSQVQSSLTGETQSLLSTAQDWAWWDDMASFARNHNAEFIDRNANPANLATVKVHLFIIYDRNGTVLHSQLLSPEFKNNASAPDDLLHIIQTYPELITHRAEDPGTAGLLNFPEGPMVIASAPILLSDKSGPASGTIVMGRYLDYGPLQRIAAVTGYDIALIWPNVPEQDLNEFGSITRRLEREPLVLVANNESRVTGFSTVEDLAGERLLISVSMGRELYKTGLANITTYLGLLALWAILTGVIVAIVIDRTVLQRMDLLANRMKTLAADPEDNPVPVLSGNDELAALEQTILHSRAELITRERQIRAFINAMPDPAALYSRDGTILFANPALALYLNKRPDELIGTAIYDHLPAEEMQKYRMMANEAIRKKTMVQSEADGLGKTLLVSHYPVMDAGGNVVQIGLLTFDISERKRLENALQKVSKKISLLNTVIFTDIQNKIFVQLGYQELLKQMAEDPKLKGYLEKEEAAVKEIAASLQFARQYNDMGANPPCWQNVHAVLLFALSHLDIGSLDRDFRLDGLSVYADSMLEGVFFNLIENIVLHGKDATIIRVWYEVTEDGMVIILEDDGPGIPADSKERIFSKGSGTSGSVGLFLSREILSITGITITETGEPGNGARFELRVPKGSYRIEGK
jgi:PAS domain S-box-containing protein